MSQESMPQQHNKVLAFFGSETFIGSLVAILSILTAVAAYQAWLQEDISGDAEIKAIRALTESNTEYISANQAIILDYQTYDRFYLSEEGSAEEEYYFEIFSEELANSVDRQEGPFDDLYYDDQFAFADSLYDESLIQFDRADAAGELAAGYQMTMLIFAVGLSLAAWGSLADESVRLRMLFGILSVIALLFGSYLWINTLLTATS